MVINNDTSNNNLSVVANSVTFVLTPGEGQCFLWDGSAWGPTDLGITSIPVPITQGGSGAVTAQAAINTLSAVSGATNEYVLTKDTATGNAIFKANVGGIPVAAAAGTVDDITADYTPDVALTDLKMVAVVAAGANTSTTPTFAPDGLTARTIVKNGGQALAAGDISGAGHVVILEYNLANTRWELLNPKVNIDLTAPGPIGGTTPAAGTFTDLLGNVVVITDSATGNVSAAQMKGQTHVVTGAYTLSLPTAAIGYKAKFKASTAAVYSIDLVTGTDVIVLNGTALTAGYKATSDGTIYNEVLVECRVAGTYDVQSQMGLAIDGGA